MTTIVIPDIHNRIRWIEPGLKKLKETYNYDKVIFLGDYFDNFGDGPYEATGTAAWLRESLQHPDRVHLIGNHDMPYIVPNNEAMWCPGFTVNKCRVINETLGQEIYKLKPAHLDQNFVFSHAGFHQEFTTHPITGVFSPETLIVNAEQQFELVKAGLRPPLFMFGYRMGRSQTGGITWCDWDHEFAPTDGINQVCGHTPHEKVQQIKTNLSQSYCIDTHTQHFGLIKDGEFSVLLRSQVLGF